MAFRDDKEALHAQVDVLRRELEEERSARERDAEEAEARLKQEREKRRELQRSKGSPTNRWLMLGVVFMVGIGVGYFFFARDRTETSRAADTRSKRVRAAGKPDTKDKPKDPLEEVLQATTRKGRSNTFEQMQLLAAAGIAHTSVGQHKQALGLLERAEKALSGSHYNQQSKAQGLGLIACGLGEAGADGPAKKMVQQIKGIVDKLYSDEEELTAYDNIVEMCINQGVSRENVRPFLKQFIETSDKHEGRAFLDIAERMATLRDAEGLAALLGRMMSKPLKEYHADLLAQVAEQLWRAGNEERANVLLDAVKPDDSASGFELARIARAMAVAGRRQQARRYVELALAALRKESGYQTRKLRKLIAVVFAHLGDLVQARQVNDNYNTFISVLVDADLLDESLEIERKRPGVGTSYILALKLARAGRAEEAYEIARKVPNSTWSPLALAAAYTIINKSARRGKR